MWKYDGEGFHPGIPGRDLTDVEYKSLVERYPDDLKGSRHYVHMDDKEHPRLASQAKKLADASQRQMQGLDPDADLPESEEKTGTTTTNKVETVAKAEPTETTTRSEKENN